jgi:thiamine pyrophosphokinase
MRAIIVANGQVLSDATYAHLVQEGDRIIAADGGASVALALGLQPDLVVGDLDSLAPELRGFLAARGCEFLDHPARKDETDTELAIRRAIELGAEEIVLLGAIGGRLDHTLANVMLLAMPELAHVRARIEDDTTSVVLLQAGEDLELRGAVGDLVSLLPLGGDVTGITTSGLEWSLQDATLRLGLARGVSNVMTAALARVSVTGGLLLVVHLRGEADHQPLDAGLSRESPTDLAEVYVGQGHLQAHVVKAKLESAGIPAILSYEAASRTFGLTVDGLGAVRVMVRAEHAKVSRQIIESPQAPDPRSEREQAL